MKKLLLLLFPLSVFGQTPIVLNDLSAFKNPSANWMIAGSVVGNTKAPALTMAEGKGILVGTAKGAKYQATDDLIFNLQHGDIKLSLDFMIPKGSNSGIYLQGRYEVQIIDSWLKKAVNDGDCGAIYHRWDESRGKDNEGFEGHAPRQNATKAPGLWNHIELDFKAPTFDASGKKLTNARFNKVVLNGIIIHENIELLGVTRGAIATTEAALGPIRIQGDHGQVAFKNIKYEVFDKPYASFSKATYEYYQGKFINFNTTGKKLIATGTVNQPTMKLAEAKSDFLIKFEGKITIPEADSYKFTTNWTGDGALIIDNDTITKGSHWYSENVMGQKTLAAGTHNYTLIYAKGFSWGPKALGLFVERIGTIKQAITERTSVPELEATPLVEVAITDETILQRSFVMFGDKKKTHAINVGMPNGLNFSYDLNQGAYLQVWRGKFLDATQMWHDRGEPQTSAPMGVIIQQTGKFPFAFLASDNEKLPDTLLRTALKYKGYRLRKNQEGTTTFPDFMYEYQGLKFIDTTIPSSSAEGIIRHLTIEGTPVVATPLYAVLAEGDNIIEVETNQYVVDDNSYYIAIKSTVLNKVFIRENNGKKQLLMPVNGLKEVVYELLF